LQARLSVNFGAAAGSLGHCDDWLAAYHAAHPERFVFNLFAEDYYRKALAKASGSSTTPSNQPSSGLEVSLQTRLQGGGAYPAEAYDRGPSATLAIAFNAGSVSLGGSGCPAVPLAFFAYLRQVEPPFGIVLESLFLQADRKGVWTYLPDTITLQFTNGASAFKPENCMAMPGYADATFTPPYGLNLSSQPLSHTDKPVHFGLWGKFVAVSADNGYTVDISAGITYRELAFLQDSAGGVTQGGPFSFAFPPLPDGGWHFFYEVHGAFASLLRQLSFDNLQVDLGVYQQSLGGPYFGVERLIGPYDLSASLFTLNTPVTVWLLKQPIKLAYQGTTYPFRLVSGADAGAELATLQLWAENASAGTMQYWLAFRPNESGLGDPLFLEPGQAGFVRAFLETASFNMAQSAFAACVAYCAETGNVHSPCAVVHDTGLDSAEDQTLTLAEVDLQYWQDDLFPLQHSQVATPQGLPVQIVFDDPPAPAIKMDNGTIHTSDPSSVAFSVYCGADSDGNSRLLAAQESSRRQGTVGGLKPTAELLDAPVPKAKQSAIKLRYNDDIYHIAVDPANLYNYVITSGFSFYRLYVANNGTGPASFTLGNINTLWRGEGGVDYALDAEEERFVGSFVQSPSMSGSPPQAGKALIAFDGVETPDRSGFSYWRLWDCGVVADDSDTLVDLNLILQFTPDLTRPLGGGQGYYGDLTIYSGSYAEWQDRHDFPEFGISGGYDIIFINGARVQRHTYAMEIRIRPDYVKPDGQHYTYADEQGIISVSVNVTCYKFIPDS
jgi:hypothetical protein